MKIPDSDPAIEIRGLRKHYPGFALGPLDLDVPRGSIFGFVGPNGAGKSTTIDLLFGMGVPDAGTIRMFGRDVAADEVAVKLRAAYVGPELDFANWGKIAHAIRFVRGFYPATWDDAHCAELLEIFQLTASDPIATLSFGSKTKLALLLALSRRPELLVLDEPTTGQDAPGVARVRSVVESVAAEGRTVIAISHDMRFVAETFERVVVMRAGRIILDGPPSQVFAAGSWDALRSTFLEPPLAAVVGERLGLGSTPTDASLVTALARG